MWTVEKPEDGPCNGPNMTRHRFRYPLGVLPGNVIQVPEKQLLLYEPGTILYQIFEEIIPFIMGALVILFFLCTTSYMGFSLLRLFYSDTLKPYKMRTLRALGKHQHHYRRRDSGSANSDYTKATSSLRSSGSRLTKMVMRDEDIRRKSSSKDEMDDDDGVELSPAISMTSPPMRKLKPGERVEYPAVVDLLDNPPQLPVLSRFPSSAREEFYTESGGRSSRRDVTILQNRRGHLWTWDPDWYQRQLEDERDTGRTLDTLQSTHSALRETASKASDFHGIERTTSLPTLTQSVKGISPTGHVRVLYENEVSTLKREESRYQMDRTLLEEVPPPLTLPAPPPSPTLPYSPASHTGMQNRFPIKPGIQSQFYTAIPKVTKKTWNEQFMILRAGPRRKATSIEEMRRKRNQSIDGQPEGATGGK